jgi:hypothetical protein
MNKKNTMLALASSSLVVLSLSVGISSLYASTTPQELVGQDEENTQRRSSPKSSKSQKMDSPKVVETKGEEAPEDKNSAPTSVVVLPKKSEGQEGVEVFVKSSEEPEALKQSSPVIIAKQDSSEEDKKEEGKQDKAVPSVVEDPKTSEAPKTPETPKTPVVEDEEEGSEEQQKKISPTTSPVNAPETPKTPDLPEEEEAQENELNDYESFLAALKPGETKQFTFAPANKDDDPYVLTVTKSPDGKQITEKGTKGDEDTYNYILS